ncbi:MAG TPA: TonB-dependent receptor [Pyrinomonadaceae bacterium]|nr:TonB-dependent receptor [Pyrinomonadaceae bacterium]
MTQIVAPDLNRQVRKRGNYFYFPALLLALLLFPFSASAQTTTSTIEGYVNDAKKAVVAGAQVVVKNTALGIERTVSTDAEGFYRVTALPAGMYTISVSATGFASHTFESIEVTLNRTVRFDLDLEVGAVQEQVDVSAAVQLIDATSAASGATVTPQQIKELPVNGRNYLDLLQLVPGVVVNRQADVGSDNSTPVLGERAGNNSFLIDGQPNKNNVSGGAAAQFNQETIAEFQVLTTGYKAEFGQASGAIVNVITRSGTNEYHGVASLFHRNDAFDSSNSLDPTVTDALPLKRWDYSLAAGGPLIKDKVHFFGSFERITENRELNFVFPPNTPAFLRSFESQFDNPSETFETRGFFKLDEQLGRHSLSQEVNYTNAVVREFLPLSSANSLPSRRNNTSARHLLLGFADTILAGNQANPWVLTLRGGYRREPSNSGPAHPEAGVGTTFNMFSSLTTNSIAGNLGAVQFGNTTSASNLDQQYTSVSANAAKLFGDHSVKFGWNFLRTKVDGIEASILQLQLFALQSDFVTFGPVNAGFFTVTTAGGLTPQANEIHLRNNYNGVFLQDDWRFLHNLTLNLGLRWDYDSEFETKSNISPRVGFAWMATPKTVVRGHFGVFYDQFRLSTVRAVPAFGGADQRVVQPFSYPRGFFGNPSIAAAAIGASLFPGGLCVSSSLTDAQIQAGNLTCPAFGGGAANQFIGIDRLNGVVAPGHALIPANAPINIANIQQLSGLTPDQYLAQAAAAIGKPAGFFFWGPFGVLSHAAIPAQLFPTDIDRSFKTPFTTSYGIGVQRELGKSIVVTADYYHRNMNDMLGIREANIAFQSRSGARQFLPPFAAGPIRTFGPWYEGTYDALVLSFTKRFSKRFTLSSNYTFADQTDNQLGVNALPTDNFVGIAPIVTSVEAGVPRTNATGGYTRANGRFVAAAGSFVNGPDLDKGPSDLSVDHTFQLNGLLELPWQIQISGIFRAQSGFHYSRTGSATDPDGNGTLTGIDFTAGRNAFTAPPFANLDMRFAKRIDFTERVRMQVLFELFNVFNHQNPAAVFTSLADPVNFGRKAQVLPGREGQIGFRFEF